MKRSWVAVCSLAFVCILISGVALANNPEVRIKDIVRVDGIRDNQLMGYGLVVGLNGSGDSSRNQFTVQSIVNMLENYGVRVSTDDAQVKNVAAVMVTATLPAFAQPGDVIDVTVSSIGDAKSLQGGTLLLTPLMAPNNEVYAVAQGPISIGGFNAKSGSTSVQQNHALVGRIPGGAIVERGITSNFVNENGEIVFLLDYNDFNTVVRIADAMNKYLGVPAAKALNSRTVTVKVPNEYKGLEILLVAQLGELKVIPDQVARVVVNERTGTIVMGAEVRIAPVSITHGGIKVTIEEEPLVSQPDPLSGGETVVLTNKKLSVEESGNTTYMDQGADVRSIVNALNRIGATPRDIIAILQALKSAGALHAELIIM